MVMPAMVGGFGNFSIIKPHIVYTFKYINDENKSKILQDMSSQSTMQKIKNLKRFGPYLAGLIEGDGTFAIKDPKNASQTSKYNPHIIVVFKIADKELANFLCEITGCGKVYEHNNRNYVLWQITRILDVYVIVSVINGYMRTPKYETLMRYADWYNNYVSSSDCKSIINVQKLSILPIDKSCITSNNWLTGFVDADGHFAISITKRSNGKARIITRFALEQRINYHRDTGINVKSSYSSIILCISEVLLGSMYTRSRMKNDKTYYSFIVIAFSKDSKLKIIEYFDRFPLWSSKYHDYISWKKIVLEQISGLSVNDKAISLRKDFNNTRTTLSWEHLNIRTILSFINVVAVFSVMKTYNVTICGKLLKP